MTLIQRIGLLTDAIAQQFKNVGKHIGAITQLKTTDKTSVVGAVNELHDDIETVKRSVASSSSISDTSASSTSTYSSQKINDLITGVKTEILGAGDIAQEFDTIKELADYLKQDKSGATAMAEAIAKRLKIDESMTLTSAQKQAVEQTLNLGDTDTDFADQFTKALAS